METFKIIINILQLLLFIYLGIATLYIFIFAVAGIFRYKIKVVKNEAKNKFAVMIPGYKEDAVIIDVANEATKQNYPKELFDIIIIADSFKKETLKKLKELPIKVIEVAFELSTKSKALNKAMAQLPDDYNVAVILDADNVMEKDFLTKLNTAFAKGFIGVQGHRAAKNVNNSFAILDAISEEINNHIFRKGHRVLGLSSAIIGSGMAFKYDFFKKLMSDVHAIGGFDKEIELKMMRDGHKIEYLKDAYVYDEKVSKSKTFSNQRRRWLSAQFHYFANYFPESIWHLITKANIDYFNKAFQMFQPPRVLLLGFLPMLTIIAFIVNPLFQNPISFSFVWLYATIACFIAITISIPNKYFNNKTLRAVLSLPKGIILMFLSLINIKGANKKFIHTEHGKTE